MEDTRIGKMAGNISRYISLVRRSVKLSFRQHCYGKSVCIFHESAHNRKGTSKHPKPPPIVIFPSAFFLLRNSIHLFAGSKFADVSQPFGPNATGTILINGTSTGLYIQHYKSKRRDTRFSNKAHHNSMVSYPPMSVDARRWTVGGILSPLRSPRNVAS